MSEAIRRNTSQYRNIQGEDIQIFPCEDSNEWCLIWDRNVEYFNTLNEIEDYLKTGIKTH